jgi:8-oxo-dGTP diphosphatase
MSEGPYATGAYGADPSRYQFIPRVLVFIKHEDSVVLVRRSKHKKLWPGRYNAPGGHIERGEDPHQAAMRELAEETGLQPKTLVLRGLIVAETGLSGSGILVFVFSGETDLTPLRPSDEGDPVWIRRGQWKTLDLLPDLPQLLELTFDQPDFFYLYKQPQECDGEDVRVWLSPVR